MSTELNTDGLAINYGQIPLGGGAQVASPEMDGVVKEIVLELSVDSLNASAAGTIMGVPLADLPARSDIFAIPAGSVIKDIVVDVVAPFVGGTFTASLTDLAGATAAATTSAASGAATGKSVVATSLNVGVVAPLYLDAKPSAPVTAGSALVTVRFI